MSEVLSVSKLKKEFGDRTLFSDVSFKLDDNKRLAIVGPNGCGKSTLLKIIVGNEEATDGNCIFAKDKTFGYLAQYQNEDIEYDGIYEYVLSVRKDILEMEERIHALEVKMQSESGDIDSIMEEYHALTYDFDRLEGNSYRSVVSGVLKGLGFNEEDFSKSMSELSGGQKTRVNLARLLVEKPDLLILDEPVNHLDMASIEWLESFLSTYKKGIIIVAHDRYFLDRIATDVYDLSSSFSKEYHGNYSAFISQKDIEMLSRQRAYDKQQKEIKHQQEVIAKLRSFNREKSVKRADSRQKLLDRTEVMSDPNEFKANMKITLDSADPSGKDVISVESLSKSYDDINIFEDISFDITRGEHVAVIGENGCGKTTLLKIINEVIPCNAGRIKIGSNVRIAYYDQEQQNLNESNTLYDELSDSYPNLTETKIRNVLAAFLFRADDAYKLVSELSGGERGRISLCKLMLSGANFLILDEPTNHLDMESKEILGNALNMFDGTVLYVSHDRYFINQTASRVLELRKDVGIVSYLGNYDYYLEKRDNIRIDSLTDTPAVDDKSASKADWEEQKKQAAEQRKIDNQRLKFEEEIEVLEEKLKQIEDMYMDQTIASNSAKLNELNSEAEQIRLSLDALYDKWESLV